VPSSSVPISREYPATSAARIAASRRSTRAGPTGFMTAILHKPERGANQAWVGGLCRCRCYFLPRPCSNSLFPKSKFRCFQTANLLPKYLKQRPSLTRQPQCRAVQPRNSLFFRMAEQQKGPLDALRATSGHRDGEPAAAWRIASARRRDRRVDRELEERVAAHVEELGRQGRMKRFLAPATRRVDRLTGGRKDPRKPSPRNSRRIL
jgi:hypothetical protein